MKDIKQRKKLHYILFEFSSVEACFQEEAYLTKPKLIGGDRKELINVQSKNFFIWGFTDILRLFIFNNLKSFAELQRLEPSCNLDDLKYCAGFFYSKEQFNLEKILEEYPLLGISFLKLKDDLLKYIKINKYSNFICEFLKEKIEEAIKDRKGDYYVFPVISYGWEDVILLFFSKSYDLIKKSILKLREIDVNKIRKKFLEINLGMEGERLKFTHIFMTTFTIFGTYFPEYALGKMKKSAEKLKKTIDKDDKAYISGIKFQVRPGHIRALEEDFVKRIPNVEIKPAPCRGDLCLHFKEENINFYKFLNYYPAIIEIIRNKRTPVISLETEFTIDRSLLAGLQLVKVKKDIKKRIIIERQDRKIIEWLKKRKILEEHSLLGFINLISDVSFFEKHYFIKQTMIPWINTFKTLERYLSLWERRWPKLKINKKKDMKSKIYKQIEDFLNIIPSTFTDRFRGTYPVGETAIIPLLTYKTSLQKFLTCIDYICLKIYKDAFLLFGVDLKYPRNFSLCSTFTTEFSPGVFSFFWSSHFVFIPDIFAYKYKLAYLPHEIGHAFWKRFKHMDRWEELALEFDSRFYRNRRSIVSEILADFFALFVGFRGNFEEFKRNFYDLSSLEEQIRMTSVKWLSDNISTVQLPSSPFSEQELSILNNALFSILIAEPFLKNILLNLKNNAASYQLFPYMDFFEGEKWIEFFLKNVREF